MAVGGRMLIQIRGTSGSGKTWVVQNIMNSHKFKKVTNNEEIMGYYCKELNLFLVGKYETACGGCDSIKSQDEACSRIRKALNRGWNVLFEGLICSHIAERYASLYKECVGAGIEVRYIFLKTPFKTCVENINIRREKAGKSPVVAKNTRKDYDSTKKSRKNMHAMGVPNKDMPVMYSNEAIEYIEHLLKNMKKEE